MWSQCRKTLQGPGTWGDSLSQNSEERCGMMGVKHRTFLDAYPSQSAKLQTLTCKVAYN